jgi:spore germination protein GerM
MLAWAGIFLVFLWVSNFEFNPPERFLMNVYRFQRVGIAALFAIATSGLLAGCSHNSSSTTTPVAVAPVVNHASTPTQSAQANPKHVVVYVLASKDVSNSGAPDANGLVAMPLKQTASDNDPATAAIQALISGSNSPLPSGTRLLNLTVDHASKIATVDFSKQFQTNFQGGETHEAQSVNSVLETLGQFPDVRQVQFLVEGHKIDSLGGNVELDEPLPTPDQNQQIALSTSG